VCGGDILDNSGRDFHNVQRVRAMPCWQVFAGGGSHCLECVSGMRRWNLLKQHRRLDGDAVCTVPSRHLLLYQIWWDCVVCVRAVSRGDVRVHAWQQCAQCVHTVPARDLWRGAWRECAH
jgi:hypothetical protein